MSFIWLIIHILNTSTTKRRPYCTFLRPWKTWFPDTYQRRSNARSQFSFLWTFPMVPFFIAFLKYIYKNSNCKLQSKPLKRTLRWAIESVCIKRIEFIEKWEGSLFPRARKTVHNNEVSVITGVRKAGFDCTLLAHYPHRARTIH